MRIGMAIDLVPGCGAFTSGSSLLDGSESDGTNALAGGSGMTSDWTGSGASISTAAATAPDGTTTAVLVTESGASGRHIIYQQLGINASTAATVSVYAKQGTRRYLQLIPSSTGGAKAYVYADLQTGTITDSGDIDIATISSTSIAAGANGFWKITLSFTNLDMSQAYMQIAMSDRGTHVPFLQFDSPDYDGSGGSTVYLWRPKVVLV